MPKKKVKKKPVKKNPEETRLRNILRRRGWPEKDIKETITELWP